MNHLLRGFVPLLLPLAVFAGPADIEIDYETFVLDNGLTLIVHEDRKAPIVAVNVWYHVGSKNESEAREQTGFAHLFEHLMFNGSENYNDDYFKALSQVGATGVNGTTNFDRTNYFQNVPVTALDRILWLESDRMGHLLGVIDQERLDEQREVVKNEKRQGENQPYGRVWNEVFSNVFPQGHPYHWTPIGSMEHLDAASLDDVQEWFETWYGPNNAVIVVAGDIDAPTALAKVEQYFGAIPPGPPPTRLEQWIPRWDAERRSTLYDRVPQARIYKVWTGPAWGNADTTLLGLASSVLSSGKNSRLYKRLVYDEQLATDVFAVSFNIEIAGVFGVVASAQPAPDAATAAARLEDIERIIDEEMARFLAGGPTREELERARAQARAGFVRGAERIGGFGGKSDILAQYQVYGGDPGLYKRDLERAEQASRNAVRDAARRWIDAAPFVLNVLPEPVFSAAADGADRSEMPTPESFPAVSFPGFERHELDNGLDVIVVNRPSVPLVNMVLMVESGYAADHRGLPGTASLAMAMLDEGTGRRDALEISEVLERLGANISAGANLDLCTVSLSTLTSTLPEALDLYADVILDPVFPAAELERQRKQRLAQIAQEQNAPFSVALRVLPKLLYGEGHAYSLPFTGSGTIESVSAIDREALAAFHATWFRPNRATLVVAGDTTSAAILPLLADAFGDWERGTTPTLQIDAVERRPGSGVYLVDRPDSQQSVVIAGHIVPPRNNPDEVAFALANDVLGGSFTARVNLNLREDKGWSYGARSAIPAANGQRPFFVYAPVQTDQTGPAMAEIIQEINGIAGVVPAREEEVERVRRQNTLTLPGRWETAASVSGAIQEIVRFGLADDYWQGYAATVAATTTADVNNVAQRYIHPDDVVWVVVGDREAVVPQIEALELGPITVIDADGNPVD